MGDVEALSYQWQGHGGHKIHNADRMLTRVSLLHLYFTETVFGNIAQISSCYLVHGQNVSCWHGIPLRHTFGARICRHRHSKHFEIVQSPAFYEVPYVLPSAGFGSFYAFVGARS